MKQKQNQVYPAEKSDSLDSWFRKLIHDPKKVLSRYVKEGMVVLDIGCGPGLFSVEMAKMVGSKGKVIAADIQEEMLKKLKDKLDYLSVKSRIKLHKCEKRRIGIKEKVDFILAFYMVHEVESKEGFLKEVKSIMKPNSKFLIIEPNFQVSKKAFNKTLEKAESIGFKTLEKPKVSLSRAALLGI